MPAWIAELINESIQPFLNSLWGTLIFWRTLALISLGLIIAAVLRKDWLIRFLISPETREHDRSVFQRADDIMSESDLYRMLEQLAADHSYFQSQRRQIAEFILNFEQVGNWYIRKSMANSTKKLIKSLNSFMEFKAVHFFVHPQNQSGENLRLVLEPALNIDREGTGKPEEMHKYSQYAQTLIKLIDDIESSYKTYRLNAKKDLGL